MKSTYVVALLMLSASVNIQGQVVDLPGAPAPKPTFASTPLPDPAFWPSSPIDWSSSQRQFPQWITNIQTGEVTLHNRSVIEVGNGLNYLDSNGAWQQSQDLIEPTSDGGAAALQIPNKVFFGPTLSTNVPIKLVTMSNLVFTTCPVGIYFFDPTTGKEALLAPLQNGIAGKSLPPNRIVYPGAFQSDVLTADLRVTVTKGAMECDTIITHKPKVSPQTFSMDPSKTLLQVRHTWATPLPPAVSVGQTPIGGLADARIDFGDFRFVRGRAFAWDGAALTDTNTPAQIDFINANPAEPVGKEWQTGSPSSLRESVLWTDVQPKLAQLPLMAKDNKKQSKPSKQIELASSSDTVSPGFVLDFTTVTGSGDYTFNTYSSGSSNTYFLSSSASFSGTVTFNAGCIIKRAPGTSLTVSGALVCNGTCGSPSIITVEDDNMYGEITGTNCATTDNAVALLNEVRGASVSGMNIRYAGEGVEFYAECCPNFQTFSNSTLEACNVGLFANGCGVTITNSAISSVPTPTSTFNGGSFSGSWGSTCNQVSLHGVVVAGMQVLASSHSPSSGLALYNRDANGYAISYNTSCWIYGLKGLTSISVSNSSGGLQGLQLGAVLITSKHLLTAAHIGFGPSNVFRFIGKSGTHYIGVVTAAQTIQDQDHGDVAVLTLDRDLPTNDVETIKILPAGVINKMTFDIQTSKRDNCPAKYLPCIGLDQWKGAYAEDVFFWNSSSYSVSAQGSIWFPSWINGYEPWGGDSGHPIMAVINNELVLIGNWSKQDLGEGPELPYTLGTSTGNAYNWWSGFAFSSTNTLVILGASRYNIGSNTCNQTHTVAIFNSVGTNLTSVAVTASGNVYYSSANLTNTSSPINGILTLPGTTNATNYYCLSQEFQGGDHWYYYPGTSQWFDYPGTFTLNSSDYFVSGAVASANLSSFVIYTNSVGETFGPVAFSYYVYPHVGYISKPGSNIDLINQALTNSGIQYTVKVFDLTTFPSNIR